MSRLQLLFKKLQEKNQKALIPFFAAGDPSLSKTLLFMHTAVEAGADILEIGVPFSDPVADGPIIQAAYTRAIAQQVDLRCVIQLIKNFRENNQHTSIVIMTYFHPIEVMGYQQFAEDIASAGVDGVLIVDLPADSNHPLFAELSKRSVDPIFLLAPTTSQERMQIVAQQGSGFLYYVSIKGITGTTKPQTEVVKEKVQQIREVTDLPIVVGFGITDAQSAKDIALVADGIVIGSALCALIEKSGPKDTEELKIFLNSLKQSLLNC